MDPGEGWWFVGTTIHDWLAGPLAAAAGPVVESWIRVRVGGL
jgi:hypothetical protein